MNYHVTTNGEPAFRKISGVYEAMVVVSTSTYSALRHLSDEDDWVDAADRVADEVTAVNLEIDEAVGLSGILAHAWDSARADRWRTSFEVLRKRRGREAAELKASLVDSGIQATLSIGSAHASWIYEGEIVSELPGLVRGLQWQDGRHLKVIPRLTGDGQPWGPEIEFEYQQDSSCLKISNMAFERASGVGVSVVSPDIDLLRGGAAR